MDAASCELTASSSSPDGYLALAALDEQPLSLAEATGLLRDCLEREMAAYANFADSGDDGRLRFDAAHAVIVQRSARVSAEDLLIDAARGAAPDADPVVVHYRMLGEPGWRGRIATTDIDSAADEVMRARDGAARHRLTLQATSVTQGHTRLSAARIPELAQLAPAVSAPSTAPTLSF